MNAKFTTALALALSVGLVACAGKSVQAPEIAASPMEAPTLVPTATLEPTAVPTEEPTPTFTPTERPSVEVFGPMGFNEAWELVTQDYLPMEFGDLESAEDYCEELLSRSNHPEFDLSACEFVGVMRGLNDVSIDGWVLEFPGDYRDLVWVAPNVMQHKDGPEEIVCGENSFQEKVLIYETSRGSIRIIFTGYEICVGP